MEPNSTKLTKITSVVGKGISESIISAIRKIGTFHIYLEAGRSPVLEERKGIAALFAHGSKLVNDPVDILSILVQPKMETKIMSLIADIAQLHIPGRGSIYSEEVGLIKAHKACGRMSVENFDVEQKNLYTKLIGICCIVQRGYGDEIARVVLETGASVPTITFGIGTGFRDKLGLLRITIPAEKEILTLVMSAYDVEEVLELMIEAGKLDQPGKGFIFLFQVKQGLINSKITRGSSDHVASMEQIIATLDVLKGGMEWRQSKLDRERDRKRKFFNGISLNLLCDEGRSIDLVNAAMSVGASGATINKQKLNIEQTQENYKISRARETCNMMISENQLNTMIEAIQQAGAFDDKTHGMILNYQIPKAFTYIAD